MISTSRLKAIEFIDAHCAGPLREKRMDALTGLLDEHAVETLDGKIVFTAKQLATLLKKTRQEQREVCMERVDRVLLMNNVDFVLVQDAKDACLLAIEEV